MVISNSHPCDCAVNMKTVLNNKAEVLSVVKPGSCTGQILEWAKNDIAELTKDDVIIICSSTNGMEYNLIL